MTTRQTFGTPIWTMKPGQLASRTIDAEHRLAALRDAQVLLH
jgi:hypothetical protein